MFFVVIFVLTFLQKYNIFFFVIFCQYVYGKGHEKTSYLHSLNRFSLEFLMTFCYLNDVNVFVAIGVEE